jgi:transcriptional regulator with XRE-family HTH domain/GAF domain-containing protein
MAMQDKVNNYLKFVELSQKISELTQRIDLGCSISETLEEILKMIINFFSAQAASIFLYDRIDRTKLRLWKTTTKAIYDSDNKPLHPEHGRDVIYYDITAKRHDEKESAFSERLGFTGWTGHYKLPLCVNQEQAGEALKMYIKNRYPMKKNLVIPTWADRFSEVERDKRPYHQFLSVPLLFGGEPKECIGVLRISLRTIPDEFEETHLLFAQAIASQLFGFIQKHDYSLELARKNEIMNNVVNAVIHKLHDKREMLNEVADILNKKFYLGIVSIYLYDEKEEELYLAGASGIDSENLGKCRYKVGKEKTDKGTTSWIFINQRLIRTNNVIGYQDPVTGELIHAGRWHVEYYRGNRVYEKFYGPVKEEHRTSEKIRIPFLGLPISLGDEKLGVIKAEFKVRDENLVDFEPLDEDLFWAVSNILALAIKLNQRYEISHESKDMNYEERLGKRVRALRTQLNKTQKNIAKEIGKVDSSYVSRLEKGRLSPSLKKLVKIAAALNVTPSELLSDGFMAPKNEMIRKSLLEVQSLVEPLARENSINSFEALISLLKEIKSRA